MHEEREEVMEAIDERSSQRPDNKRQARGEHDVSDSSDTDNECSSSILSISSLDESNCLKESKPYTSNGNGLSGACKESSPAEVEGGVLFRVTSQDTYSGVTLEHEKAGNCKCHHLKERVNELLLNEDDGLIDHSKWERGKYRLTDDEEKRLKAAFVCGADEKFFQGTRVMDGELEEKEVLLYSTSGAAQTLANRYSKVEDLALPRELGLCEQRFRSILFSLGLKLDNGDVENLFEILINLASDRCKNKLSSDRDSSPIVDYEVFRRTYLCLMQQGGYNEEEIAENWNRLHEGTGSKVRFTIFFEFDWYNVYT
eukprot:88291_1